MVGNMEKVENRFNLVDEPWIPVVGEGLVSLNRVFSDSSLKALGGNPVQKIALTKLLLAICQAAAMPKDDEEWAQMGAEGMAQKAYGYLQEKKDCFWLYGERPFLQMPAIKKAAIQNYGAVLPDISTGNTTVLLESQVEKELSDAEKALLVVQLMGFGLGGKKTDNSVSLTVGYKGKQNEKGKPSTGKPGPSIGFMGFLHNFLIGNSLLQTCWVNLFTQEKIREIGIYPSGIGTPPWEKMPEEEACSEVTELQRNLIGRLIPLSRYIVLAEEGVHYSEGILHPGYLEGVVDPSVAVDFKQKKPRIIWSDPEKRPWRNLPSLLSFLVSGAKGFDCYQLKMGLPRIRKVLSKIGIWSGGLRVSSNAGEQFVSGSDDFVESEIFIESNFIGETWFNILKQEMEVLDSISKIVYGAILNFFKTQSVEGKSQAAQASSLFWQLCEHHFQDLVNACGEQNHKSLRKVFSKIVDKVYNTYCPRDTARQLDAWAKNRPNLRWYVQGENSKPNADVKRMTKKKPKKKQKHKTDPEGE